LLSIEELGRVIYQSSFLEPDLRVPRNIFRWSWTKFCKPRL